MIIYIYCFATFAVWAIGVGVFFYVWDAINVDQDAKLFCLLMLFCWPIVVWFWLGYMFCKWSETKPVDYSEKLK